MAEGFSFHFSVIAPLISILSVLLSVVTAAGSFWDLAKQDFGYTAPWSIRFSAIIFTAYGIISQSIGWLSGYLPTDTLLFGLPQYFSEASFGLSAFLLLISYINRKRRYSD